MHLFKSLFIVFSFLFSVFTLSAQDTIRVMQYNLMFYGLYTDFCTAANNNADAKDGHLRTILGHYKPDIFVVNELGRGAHNLTRIKENVLNIEGVDFFEHATYTNTGNGWFANGLFYDSRKFGLHKEIIVSTLIRDINLYTLYHKTEDLEHGADTVFLTCIVAHLKAGNTSSDQQTRTAMVNNVMSYLSTHSYSGNIMFLGDFNMKASFEQAYQMMINNANENIRFYDPINIEGQWGNNSAMAPYHTQSPRTGSHDCFVGGGLDDRYDFILATRPIMEGTAGFQYIEDSYRAMGQDGQRYNQSLISPPNYSEPAPVITALYEMSDHLPVVMKMLSGQFTPVATFDAVPDIRFNNPVNDRLNITIDNSVVNIKQAGVYSLSGAKLVTADVSGMMGSFELNIGHLPSGVFVLQLQTDKGVVYAYKIVKL